MIQKYRITSYPQGTGIPSVFYEYEIRHKERPNQVSSFKSILNTFLMHPSIFSLLSTETRAWLFAVFSENKLRFFQSKQPLELIWALSAYETVQLMRLS